MRLIDNQHGTRPAATVCPRRGVTIVYVVVLMTIIIAFISLAVDLGRVQVAKTELQSAADSAARYGCVGISNSTASAKAISAAANNSVDGSAVVLQAGDIQTGSWNSSTRTFTAGGASPNAIRVIAHRSQSRSTGIPLLFAGALGRKYLDISAQSIAVYQSSVSSTITAQAKANPWLAGMPNGTTANDYDSAPNDSPQQVSGVTISAGTTLNFSFDGSVSYLPSKGSFGPDGNLSRMIYNGWYTGFNTGRENGMSNLTAPITGVVGVFLSNTQPNLAGSAPADLDFSTTASRDFSTLSPQLRQPFFIGDGLREDGVTAQDFVVPAGATRLFIGVMDGQQWSDNTGSFQTSVTKPAAVTMVK